jgi:hypothetical protein
VSRELGLVLFIGAALALFAYDLFGVAMFVYRSRFAQGAVLVVLVFLLIYRAWDRRG